MKESHRSPTADRGAASHKEQQNEFRIHNGHLAVSFDHLPVNEGISTILLIDIIVNLIILLGIDPSIAF